MSILVEKVGKLSLIKMTIREKEVFMEAIAKEVGETTYDLLEYFLGDDFLKFVDTFSGQRFTIPTRDKVVKLVNYIKIYAYVERGGFSDEAYEKASVLFNKRKSSVSRIVGKVKKLMF